ncbi:LexA family protein [Sedimentisphaera salicampi]|uniref:LexA repressor n=1 Tax=Sedimentisphaera salicampi TaxID=1941349 RepID=A0A1W6LIX4_9BACT|nr:translesion error-prone DNA polymerase V autoproteolytic subunit [Sedimentisphaera salicampi]ARN55737.1 LexA repressor [Sedimentisphaera salicampi]OXU16158.1 LexA repressor [Sedimentisphaera salicampi]
MAMKIKVEEIYKPDTSSSLGRPLFISTVPAGFPSPASDYEESKLDLNKHLIKNPPATFFVRVSGSSMKDSGIHSGDLLIVDRSLEPKSGNVVVASLDSELTVKRIRIRKNEVILEPDNEDYKPQAISEERDFEVWGVVTSVIHKL